MTETSVDPGGVVTIQGLSATSVFSSGYAAQDEGTVPQTDQGVDDIASTRGGEGGVGSQVDRIAGCRLGPTAEL